MKGDITQYEQEIKDFFLTKGYEVKVKSKDFNSFSYKSQQCSIVIETTPPHKCDCPTCICPKYGTSLAGFSLIAMPGCCGIVISTGAWTLYSMQGQGIGQFLHNLRIKIATDWGYGVLMCTNDDKNKSESHILVKYAWESVKQFRNPRTGNSIDVQTLNLNPLPNTYTK